MIIKKMYHGVSVSSQSIVATVGVQFSKLCLGGSLQIV